MLAWTQMYMMEMERTEQIWDMFWKQNGQDVMIHRMWEVRQKKEKKEEFVKQLGEQKYQMERWRPGSLWGGGALGTQVHWTDGQRS